MKFQPLQLGRRPEHFSHPLKSGRRSPFPGRSPAPACSQVWQWKNCAAPCAEKRERNHRTQIAADADDLRSLANQIKSVAEEHSRVNPLKNLESGAVKKKRVLMVKQLFEDQRWEDVLERLKTRQIPSEQIGHAIVKLGKPFDSTRILAAKSTVALYLDYNDSWARHEAMWFLTAWGKFKEYQPALIRALQTDPDLDNRSFAATSLGRLQEGTGDKDAVAALKAAVEDETQDQLVRLYAYGALIQVVNGASGDAYSPHEHNLSDVDWEWVRSLAKTTS